jgi:hypothetical protein
METKSCSSCSAWAKVIAHERQERIRLVRSIHPFGKLLAEAFDQLRDTDQGIKVSKLLNERQCDSVIKSAGKSNLRADLGSALAFLLGFAGLVGCFSHFRQIFSDLHKKTNRLSNRLYCLF